MPRAETNSQGLAVRSSSSPVRFCPYPDEDIIRNKLTKIKDAQTLIVFTPRRLKYRFGFICLRGRAWQSMPGPAPASRVYSPFLKRFNQKETAGSICQPDWFSSLSTHRRTPTDPNLPDATKADPRGKVQVNNPRVCKDVLYSLCMPTIVEVAKRAKVSTATVSNVIRGTRKVSEGRAARVQAAIRELNYFPNEIARSLKVRQTRMLAMVLPDITNPFFPEIIRGAEDAAFARGYFLLTANTDEQPGRERRIVAALRSYRVDGILLATSQGSQDHDTSHIAAMVDAGVSVVCLDRAVPNVSTDAVLLDNVGGARECVRHLAKQGHREIAIITGAMHLQTGYERLQGYKLALEDAGIAFNQQLVKEGDFRLESGLRLGEELLQRPTRPTAIFVCNGVMALGVLNAFEQAHVHCPRDIALATFDDISVDHGFHSHITAVVQPSYEMGSRAATILMDRVEGVLADGWTVVRVTPRLVLRESTSIQLPPHAGHVTRFRKTRKKTI